MEAMMNVVHKILAGTALLVLAGSAQAQTPSGDEIGRSSVDPPYNADTPAYPAKKEKPKAPAPACINGKVVGDKNYSGPCVGESPLRDYRPE
jgi:hypothetical protein